MLDFIVTHAAVYLLVFARCIALMLTLPLFSTRTVSRTAKVALAFYMAFLLFPQINVAGYESLYAQYAAFSLAYVPIILGEAMIGVITGFFVTIIFSAFSSAGQFFSFQTGLGASEVYDALAQVSNPVLGQLLNLVAMLVFLKVDGFQQLFLGGLLRSFQAFNVFTLISAREIFYTFLLSGLTDLFFDALMIALPITGVLFLVAVSMGIISKAAPQMNLMQESLPVTLSVSFLLLMFLLPTMCAFFQHSFDAAFAKLEGLYIDVSGGLP